MELALDESAPVAETAARGTFNLFWGVALSTLISAVGAILLARLLPPSDFGLVTIAFVVPALIATFRDWGINSAMIKHIAQYRSEKDVAGVKSVMVAGFLFELIVGLGLSAVAFLFSGFLAATFFHYPALTPLIKIASVSIFANAIVQAAQSVFAGFERMELFSIASILLSLFKTILAPLLVVMGFGLLGAVWGSVASSLFASLIIVLILYTFLYRDLPSMNYDRPHVFASLRRLLAFGLPLSISSTISGFITQFYLIIAAASSSSALIGNYQVAVSFTLLVTFFSTPISTVLFPAFSKLNYREDAPMLKNGFRLSVKYGTLLVVPVSVALMALSQSSVYTLFGHEYAYAPFYLTLSSINYLPVALGGLSVGSLIMGQGKTRVNLELMLITLTIGLPLGFLLIPSFGIIGLIVAGVIDGLPGLIVGLWWVRRQYAATVDFSSSAKILLASGAAGVVAYLVDSRLGLADWAKLVICAGAFLAVYVTMAPALGAIDHSDAQNLRTMLKSFGRVSRIFTPLLDFSEMLMRSPKVSDED